MSVKNERTKGKVFFPNLDALRFIAFSLVFLQHGCYKAFAALGSPCVSDSILARFFLAGDTGVQIFFVLSGFLITYLILLEINKNGHLDIGRFYIRRTLRIWPLYFVVVFFSFVIYPLAKDFIGIHSDLCSRPLYYYTFLANFDLIHIYKTCPGKEAMTQNIVWSVSIEEQFYLVWPLLFLIFRRWRPVIFVIVLLVCLAFRWSVASIADLYYHTLAVMGDLAIGGLGAYLALYSKKLLHYFECLPRSMIVIFYLVMLALCYFKDTVFNFPYAPAFSRWIPDLLWIFIILEQNFSKHSFFKLGRLHFCSKWGKYTYGLYMLHPIAILIVDIGFRVAQVDTGSFFVLLVMAVLSFLLSLPMARLSYFWLERPFLKLKEHFAVIETKKA